MNELTLVGRSARLMTSKEVAELVEKRHDNVKRTIETLAATGVISFPQSEENPTSESGGRPGTVYLLDKRSSLIVVAQLSPEFTARVVDRWQELEAQAGTAVFLPATYAEALRALANEVEMKALAITQRDEAIRTKALIGSRREATAMATATVAVRQANSLKDELGIGTNWKTAKAIGWIKDYFALSQGMWMVVGKKLKSISDEFGYEVRRVESEKYGAVNSYHVSVIEKLRARLEADDNMLGKYRAA